VRSINYRPDVDALRGLSVLLVVIFHTFPSLIPGGFIGVDVFFVISGYLITSIILRSLKKDDFSIKEFYSRRVKRLFPALITVLLVALIAGWLVLLPREFKSLGDHIAHAVIYWLNYDLIGEFGYFDTDIELKPLVHLWTLSVEEQYYIFWPVLLLLIAKQKIITPVFVVGLVIVTSFVANIYYISDYSEAVYFHTLTRVWQLAAGSMLAIVMIDKEFVENKLTALAGVLLIILSALFLTKDSTYPGWWALLPTIGAILFIVGNVRFSQWGGMLNVGLISYPLYLWHWVVISFATIYIGERPSINIMIVIIVLSFLLAWLTYRYIEPIRHLKYRFTAKILFVLLFSIGLIGQYVKEERGMPDRQNFSFLNEMLPKGLAGIDEQCKDHVKSKLGNDTTLAYCRSSHLEKKKYIAIIGDSHAGAVYHGLAKVAEDTEYGVILLGENKCATLIGFEENSLGKTEKKCSKSTLQIFDFIKKENKIDKIIIVARGPYYIHGEISGQRFTDKKIESSLINILDENKTYISYSKAWSDTLEEINNIKHINDIYYLLENPELDFDMESLVDRRSFGGQDALIREKYISKSLHLKRMNKYREVVNKFEKSQKLKVIDTTDLFCSEDKCYAYKDGNFLYLDDDHLSPFGAYYVMNSIKSKLFD